MTQKIIVSILVLIGLIGCSSDSYVPPSISKSQENENMKKYHALQNVHVWVQVRNLDTRHKYCDLLASKGMIVECETYRAVTSSIDHNEIALTCPEVKKEVTPLLAKILKMPHVVKVDVSSKSGYNQKESCSKFSAVIVEVFESNL